jgi:hypothetical protein
MQEVTRILGQQGAGRVIQILSLPTFARRRQIHISLRLSDAGLLFDIIVAFHFITWC